MVKHGTIGRTGVARGRSCGRGPTQSIARPSRADNRPHGHVVSSCSSRLPPQAHKLRYRRTVPGMLTSCEQHEDTHRAVAVESES